VTRPYFDLGFSLCLLFDAPGRQQAHQIFRRLGGPIQMNRLHQMQLESGMKRESLGTARGLTSAKTIYDHCLSELLFEVAPADFNQAAELVLGWNASLERPPHWALLLHTALAVTEQYTHYCSFDPVLRGLARSHELQLLPTKL